MKPYLLNVKLMMKIKKSPIVSHYSAAYHCFVAAVDLLLKLLI
jgi:hypothetical protein